MILEPWHYYGQKQTACELQRATNCRPCGQSPQGEDRVAQPPTGIEEIRTPHPSPISPLGSAAGGRVPAKNPGAGSIGAANSKFDDLWLGSQEFSTKKPDDCKPSRVVSAAKSDSHLDGDAVAAPGLVLKLEQTEESPKHSDRSVLRCQLTTDPEAN